MQYERQLEEARKRDHRRVGRELGLFTFSDVVGQGIPLFLPKGETVRHLMESYVREMQERTGHQHVWTGHVVKSALYERSGHREHYADAMFPPMVDGETEFLLKPMNCPSHMIALQRGAAQLPRPAPPLRRVRDPLPLREVG